MLKRRLYEKLIERIDQNVDQGNFLQASWYIYAVIEDRLISMLENSGGATNEQGRPLRMLGKKMAVLKGRAVGDALLRRNFCYDKIDAWSRSRNGLMHAMAEGTMTIDEIDREAKMLAEDGQSLVREVAAGAMRLKKHRDSV